MRLRDLIRTLNATEVRALPPGVWQRCMTCRMRTVGYADARPVLCRACTYRELGVTEYILALQVEFHLSRKVVEARLEKYGPPYVSPKEWLTPRSRLRK